MVTYGVDYDGKHGFVRRDSKHGVVYKDVKYRVVLNKIIARLWHHMKSARTLNIR